MSENKKATSTTNNAQSNKKATPSKPRQKQIKLSHIKSTHKEINKMESYLLDEEKQLIIKYYKIFPETKIHEMLTDLQETIAECKDKKIDYFNNDTDFMQFLHFMIIKHMTSLKDEIPNDFSTQVNVLNQIIDIGLFKRLFDEVLEGEEVLKVLDRVNDLGENMNKINMALEKELAKLERLENNDILKQPFNVMNDPNGMIQ